MKQSIAIIGANGKMGAKICTQLYLRTGENVFGIIHEKNERISELKPLVDANKQSRWKERTAGSKPSERGPAPEPLLITKDISTVFAGADTAIFCLRGEGLQQVLERHGKEFEGKLLLYCDPYTHPDAISSMAGGASAIQFMPSALLYTDHYSFIPFCPSAGGDTKKEDDATAILNALGRPFRVKQEEMRQYAVLIGMLPAIFASLASEIMKRGKVTGADTLEILRSMLSGTSKLLNEMNPEEIVDVVKTEGGLTDGVLKSINIPLLVKKMFDEAERRFSKKG
jgi:pyrroline-5-carboxylate reductase